MLNIFYSHAENFSRSFVSSIHKTWDGKGGLAFKLTALFLILPALGSLINFNIYHLPIFIGGAAILLICCLKPDSRPILITGNLEAATCILFILIIIQVLTERGFSIISAGGYVVLMTVIFLSILKNQSPALETIIRWISLIFQFLMISLAIELVIIILGKQETLTQLFYADVTTHYKNYNPADFIHFLGLAPDSGGPNSILMGSQVGSMLSLFSALWFFYLGQQPFYLQNKTCSLRWLLFSALLLLLTMNGTTGFLTILGIAIPYFFSRNRRQKTKALIFISIALLILYFLISNGYLFERVFSNELATFPQETVNLFKKSDIEYETKDISVIDFYLFIFFRPVQLWLDSGTSDQFLGSGNNFFLNEDLYIGGDFGFGSEVLLKTGLIWGCTFLLLILSICWPVLTTSADSKRKDYCWIGLAKFSALVGFLWLASLIHYTPAIQNAGGYVLFSLSLALVIYCQFRASSLLRGKD